MGTHPDGLSSEGKGKGKGRDEGKGHEKVSGEALRETGRKGSRTPRGAEGSGFQGQCSTGGRIGADSGQCIFVKRERLKKNVKKEVERTLVESGLSETSGWKRNMTDAAKFAKIEVMGVANFLANDVTDVTQYVKIEATDAATFVKIDATDATKFAKIEATCAKKREDRSEGSRQIEKIREQGRDERDEVCGCRDSQFVRGSRPGPDDEPAPAQQIPRLGTRERARGGGSECS